MVTVAGRVRPPRLGHLAYVTLRNPFDALRIYDVATRREWLATGLSAKQLRTLAETGALVRMHYGTYATAQAIGAAKDSADKHGLQAAAVAISLDSEHVISHESAAIIHHLDLLHEPCAVTLTRQPGATVKNQKRKGVIIRTAALPGEHTQPVGRARVTTPARTVADLARVLPFMGAVVVADNALHTRKVSKQKVLDVVAGTRWPGTKKVEQVIEFSDGLAESVLESCARVVFHEADLPTPQLQVEFRDPATLSIARVDFYWPEYSTAAEGDGMKKYEDNPGAMRQQFNRDRVLRDLGQKLVHFTWRELFDYPEVVIARIRKAFAARSPW
jgi:very-short-patch-repair endonuclease